MLRPPALFRLLARVICACAVLVTASAGVPALAAPGTDGLKVDVWTVTDGLPQNTVTGLVQDRDGYLWIATRKGLARFDGLEFQTLEVVDGVDLSTLRLTAIAADDDGVWIGAYGAGLYYLRAGRLEHFGPEQGVPTGTIWDLRRDRLGRIWAATGGGARVHIDGRWQAPALPDSLDDSVNTVLVDRRERVWLGTSTRGAVRLAGDDARAFGVEDGLPVARVFSLVEDAAGTIWAATPEGVATFDEASQRFVGVEALRGVRAYQVHADRRGTVWVATYGRGVLRVDESGVDVVPGLPSDFILALLEDREGTMWVGTVSGGLARLVAVDRQLIDTADGLPNFPVTTVYQDGAGTYWIGTQGGGLVSLDAGVLRRYTTADGLPSDSITSVARAVDGGVWVGTSGGGAIRLEQGRVAEHLTVDQLGQVVRTIEAGAGGRLYFAANGVVARNADGTLRRWTTRDGLGSNDIRVMYATAAGLYIGTFGGGLSLLHPDDRLETWDADDGLHPFVTSLHVDESSGVVWIGTYGGGLFRMQGDSLHQISEAEGLDDNVVFDIMEDRRHRLWLMMNRGVSVIDPTLAARVAEGDVSALPSTFLGGAEGITGIDGTDGNQPQSWLATDGRIWFATTGGVAIVDPALVGPPDPPPTVRLDRFLAGGTPLPISDAGMRLEARDVDLAFSAPDLRRAARLRYEHRLVGYDTDWTASGSARIASYTNLAPGTYRFEVRARRGAGGPFSQPTAVTFTVVPRFFETPWFLALVALGGIAGLAAAYTARVRGMRRRELTLQQLVDTRTAALRHEMVARERADAERRALDERVQQAQRLESLGVLAGGIAHDFNNLLVGVLGEAALARADLPPGSRARAHLQRVEQAALQASELTAQMLAYSGRGGHVRAAVDLHDTVRDTLRLLSPVMGRQVSVELTWPPNVPPVEGDPSQMRQVVMNLLTNASDAIGDRPGRIGVAAEAVTITAETVQHRDEPLEPGPYVRLQVSDDGGGMDTATTARIFEPFFSTKFTGRGLGLAAVRGIVRTHRGWIDVTSAPGVGTTFTLWLRATTRRGVAPRPVAEPRPVPLGTGPATATRPTTILVVDDERTVRDVARAALEIAGFGVEAVDSGEAALEVYRRHPDRYGLVLLDLTLPGVSGRQVFEDLRAMRPAVPILLTSGFSIDEVADLVAQPGVAFVPKPWRPQDLATQAAHLLAGPPAAP